MEQRRSRSGCITGTYSIDMETIVKKAIKQKRTTPYVNGERVSFVALGRLYGCDRETAALRYKAVAGKVTWAKLDRQFGQVAAGRLRQKQNRIFRNNKIIHARQNRRRPLASIAATHNLSVQRIQQIAGALH